MQSIVEISHKIFCFFNFGHFFCPIFKIQKTFSSIFCEFYIINGISYLKNPKYNKWNFLLKEPKYNKWIFLLKYLFSFFVLLTVVFCTHGLIWKSFIVRLYTKYNVIIQIYVFVRFFSFFVLWNVVFCTHGLI